MASVLGALRVAAAALALLSLPAAAAGQSGTTGGRLLDVPYVAQSADLCGGAALAMVLRYWGDGAAAAEDFAALVDTDAGGIRTDRLVDAARHRGWRAWPAGGAVIADLAAQIDRGRPPVALIEERPGVLHYVVVVAIGPDAVVVHDPARAPFREMTTDEFLERWSVTNRWMLLVLPADGDGSGGAVNPAPVAGTPLSPLETVPCGDLLARGIRQAEAGLLDDAERSFAEAITACPSTAAPYRELAGVRFRQRDWPAADRLAARATSIDPADDHAWRIAAAARYRSSDLSGSLDALTEAGESAIDGIEVAGAGVTPHPVVVDATGLTPHRPLDGRAFDLARRRLAELPVAERSRLGFRPSPAGGVIVDAVIAERDRWPRQWPTVAGMAARAAVARTVRVDLAGLTGSAEVWTGLWRWSDRRPLVGFGLATPSPSGLPGVTHIEARWETETYALGAPRIVTEQSRRRVALGVSDWATSTLRWRSELALDRFDTRDHGSVAGALEWHRADDRLAAGIEASLWSATGRDAFIASSAAVAWRSTSAASRPGWSMRTGVDTASSSAPLGVWPGAGTGQARSPLLRAHPLLERDVITGEAIGRRVWHGSVEHARPVFDHPLARLAVVGFLDAVHVRGRAGGVRDVTHADVGAGLRVGGAGPLGSVDVTLAYGLADGRTTLSFQVRAPWPSLFDAVGR